MRISDWTKRPIAGAVAMADEKRVAAVETKKLVSVLMIVKNEKRNIEDALRCACMVGDQVVIVDTGSTDGTKTFLTLFQIGYSGERIKIFDFSWTGSFADARNFAESKCSMPWIFWMDADDRFDERTAKLIRGLVYRTNQNIYGPIVDQRQAAFAFTIKTPATEDYKFSESPNFLQTRLYPNRPEIRWEDGAGGMHESVDRALAAANIQTITVPNVEIVHIGYMRRDERLRKSERNAMMLLQEPASQTSSGASLDVERARNLLMGEKWEEAARLAGAVDILEMRFLHGVALFNMKNYGGADEAFEAVEAHHPDATYYRGMCAHFTGNMDGAIEHLRRYLADKQDQAYPWGTDAPKLRKMAWEYLIEAFQFQKAEAEKAMLTEYAADVVGILG